ncbi:MAG: hypothetical protein IJ816_05005 [Alloprevotella sp.]|nr:hypothetical protein [Alloprevotella sp.]
MPSKNKKDKRLNAIRTLLQTSRIGNQAELSRELKRSGIKATQPTISSDLKRLGVAKVHTVEGDRYVLPENKGYQRIVEHDQAFEYVENSSVRGVQFAQGLAVVKTRPGFAAGLAHKIDQEHLSTVIGTVAGHDTILVVCAENAPRETFKSELAGILTAFQSILENE